MSMWLLWWTEHLNHNNNKFCFAFDIYQENKHVFVANHFSQQQQQQQQQPNMELRNCLQVLNCGGVFCYLILFFAHSCFLFPTGFGERRIVPDSGTCTKDCKKQGFKGGFFFAGSSRDIERWTKISGDGGLAGFKKSLFFSFFGFRKTTKTYVESWRKM